MVMNERIRELAIQSGLPTALDYHQKRYEKFAELIVLECVKVVDETMTENQEMNIGLVMASAAIVAHFGVEE
jgi:hypothetical protein